MTPDPKLLEAVGMLAFELQRLNRRLRNGVIVVALLVVAIATASNGGI